jgi:FkbM family methyltransferase
MEMNELDKIVEASQLLGNDFFGSWIEKDFSFLSQFKVTHDVGANRGEVVDWLGIRTDGSLHQWLGMDPRGPGIVLDSLPFPDDKLHADAIEYIALLFAVDRTRLTAASGGPSSFNVVEIGASYAPWATAAAVVALRLGFDRVHCLALEASRRMLEKMEAHAERNGVLHDPRVSFRPFWGAISPVDGFVYFPDVDSSFDNGAQVVSSPVDTDYRGLKMSYKQVPAISMETFLVDTEKVDFLHIDVQGSEQGLLSSLGFLRVLKEKVVVLYLATHSREIEGLAMRMLSADGWCLLRERPVKVDTTQAGRPDVISWTSRDGGQIWVNRSMLGSEYLGF